MTENKMITILGPTASGKTKIATNLAFKLNAEIISADSRQVYRGMNIGTGKDIEEYTVNNTKIAFHLIDILNAGDEYNLFLFKKDFDNAVNKINMKGKKIIICGGSGMYIEQALGLYKLIETPKDINFRLKIKDKPIEELIEMLKYYKPMHNTTDIFDKERLIRAIEIAKNENGVEKNIAFDPNKHSVFCTLFDRETLKRRIHDRLVQRLNNGMIEEVEILIKNGLTASKLEYYGLEYKFISKYLSNDIDYKTMVNNLYIAICQFAKRQMTWFRRMEKKGVIINFLDGNNSTETNVNAIIKKSFL